MKTAELSPEFLAACANRWREPKTTPMTFDTFSIALARFIGWLGEAEFWRLPVAEQMARLGRLSDLAAQLSGTDRAEALEQVSLAESYYRRINRIPLR